MKNNVDSNNTELVSILNSHFKKRVNLARVKFIALCICALCKVQTVGFEKLSNAFDSNAKPESSLRRLQRFIGNFCFNSDWVAKLIFSLLPHEEKLILTIDRTNWKHGQKDINVFMLGITWHGVAFPLMFALLPKKGNSNTKERIKLIKRFIKLFGKDCIDCLVADREFVGEHWIEWLNANQIRYYIRIRKNFRVFLPHKDKYLKVSWLFNNLKIGQFIHYKKCVKICGQICYLSGGKIKGRDNKQDFLIIVSFNKPEQARIKYAHRWQIETCFKSMKSSGFDIEKTHLQILDRIERLLLIVMIAFVWCYKTGIYLHQNVKPIKIKNHGRKAKSIFKYGLSFIASILLNNKNQNNHINIYSFLSCT